MDDATKKVLAETWRVRNAPNCRDEIYCDTCGVACARIAGIPWEALGLEDQVTITCAGCDPELSFDRTVDTLVAERLERIAEDLRR